MPSGWIDLTMLGVLAVSVIVGLWRGLVFELLSLAGWVAAWFAAVWAAPQLAPQLPVGAPGSALNHAAAFALAFIGALIVWSLVARLVRVLIRATPLSPIDRVLGAGFGLLRGGLLLLAITVIIAMTPLAKAPAWQQSQGVAWLGSALQTLKPWLSPGLSQHLPA